MERPKKATLKKISADKGGRVRRKTALPPDLHPKAQHEEVVPDKPLSVTVIIPYLSELAPARECLDSLRKQDEGIMEILIADVTPKPTLKALLKAVAAKDRRVVLMPQDRSAGRIHHLNEAIHIAKGEFIAIVDESVTVTAEWLEHLHVSMHRDKVTTIVGPLFTAGKEMQSVPPPSGKRKLEDEAAAFYMRNRDRRVTTTMVCGLCLLLKKDLIERINGFDPSFETEGGEIEDYCLRAEMEGFRVVIAADVLVGSTRDPVIRANGKAFVEKWSSHDAAGASGQRLRSWKIRMAAEQYEFAGRVDDAIAELKAGIAAFPQSKRLYTLLVWTYIRAKRFDEASEFIKSTPDAIKKNREWLEITAFCLIGSEQVAQAKDCVDRALAIRATSARAILLKGILAEYDDDLEKAAECYEQASLENPADGGALAHLGGLRWSQDDKSLGLKLVERAFVLSPTDLDILARFKDMATQAGKLDLLARRLEDASVFHPKHRGIASTLADVHAAVGNYRAAFDDLKRSLTNFDIEENVLQYGKELRQHLTTTPDKKRKPMLSVCMIVKNEERNLVRSLSSIEPIADEIIVVDTGSIDRTKAVSAFFGAAIYETPWVDDFSAARNISLDQARGQWILVLDADEVIGESDYETLRTIVGKKSTKKTAYMIQTRDYLAAEDGDAWKRNEGEYPEERGAGWIPGGKVRLFPNDSRIRFRNKVHESVEESLQDAGIPVKECSVVIHHYGRLDALAVPEKATRSLEIARLKLKESGGKDPVLVSALARQEQESQQFEEALPLWEQYATLRPSDVEGWLGTGICRSRLGKYVDAIPTLRKVLGIDPTSREGNVELAQAYLHAGRTGDAVVLLEEYCDTEKTFHFAHIVLAAAYLCHGREAKAQRVMRLLKEQGVAYDQYLRELANAFEREGKNSYAEALDSAVFLFQNTKRW